jgi:hydroxyacylglutathione hydrolase
MGFKLLTKEVGPYGMNSYVILDESSNTCAIIDPGGDPEVILEMTSGKQVMGILITHGHPDHVMALEEIKNATNAPVYLHQAEATAYELDYDQPLEDGREIAVGNLAIKVIHVPGHTPGQCCFDLGDGRIIVGDTIFVGGPGKTDSPEDFETSMKTMQSVVFAWPDGTIFYPGHGPWGSIGAERPAFEAFISGGWSSDTQGDITWE